MKNAIRWILVLPTALAAAIAGNYVGGIVPHVEGFWIFRGPVKLLSLLVGYGIGGVLMGFFFMIAGVRVAPNHKREVLKALACVAFLITGFILFCAMDQGNAWSIYAFAWVVVGVVMGIKQCKTDCDRAEMREAVAPS